MKIRIRDIEPSPIRVSSKLNEDRVDMLIGSIRTNGWKGVLYCRPHPTKKGKYQLQFGHHRIEAVKRLGWTELEVGKHITIEDDVKDYEMLWILVDENRNYMQHEADTQISAVKALRDFLNNIMRSFETWQEAIDSDSTNYKFIICRIYPEPMANKIWGRVCSTGVGRDAILAFLNIKRESLREKWNSNEIDLGLKMLKGIEKDKLDEEALLSFPNQYQTKEFVEAVIDRVPKDKQRKVAKEVQKKQQEEKERRGDRGQGGGRNIKLYVDEVLEESTSRVRHEPEDETLVVKIQQALRRIEETGHDFSMALASLNNLIMDKDISKLKRLKTKKAQIIMTSVYSELEALLVKVDLKEEKIEQLTTKKTKHSKKVESKII